VSYGKARAILCAEEALRLSPRVQGLMAQAEADPTRDWIGVVREVVDPEICSQFDITPHQKHTLLSWYPSLKPVVHYGRHNRARPSLLQEGDEFIDVPLVDITGRPSSIGSVAPTTTARPTVVVAGSIT